LTIGKKFCGKTNNLEDIIFGRFRILYFILPQIPNLNPILQKRFGSKLEKPFGELDNNFEKIFFQGSNKTKFWVFGIFGDLNQISWISSEFN